jgi:ABC-type amino acid transport system permease subunit
LAKVERVVEQRIGMLRRSNPELSVGWTIFDNDWALITLSQAGVLFGFEFVESETSWDLDGRPILYQDALRQGVTVVVIVPQEAYLSVRRSVRGIEGGITVLAYDWIGITLIPRPS